MLKALLAIFFTSIEFHAFLLVKARSPAMRAQSAKLVDAAIVGFIKLEVDLTLPIAPRLMEIARMDGIGSIVMNTRHENARLVIKQGQRIGSNGNHGQSMRIAA